MKRDDLIAALAFKMWTAAGRPKNRDLEFWLEAERRIDAGSRVALHHFIVNDIEE